MAMDTLFKSAGLTTVSISWGTGFTPPASCISANLKLSAVEKPGEVKANFDTDHFSKASMARISTPGEARPILNAEQNLPSARR